MASMHSQAGIEAADEGLQGLARRRSPIACTHVRRLDCVSVRNSLSDKKQRLLRSDASKQSCTGAPSVCDSLADTHLRG